MSLIHSDIKVICPNCHITVRCPFLPYDLNGNFRPRKWDIACPKCGSSIKVSTKEIEARLESEMKNK